MKQSHFIALLKIINAGRKGLKITPKIKIFNYTFWLRKNLCFLGLITHLITEKLLFFVVT